MNLEYAFIATPVVISLLQVTKKIRVPGENNRLTKSLKCFSHATPEIRTRSMLRDREQPMIIRLSGRTLGEHRQFAHTNDVQVLIILTDIELIMIPYFILTFLGRFKLVLNVKRIKVSMGDQTR